MFTVKDLIRPFSLEQFVDQSWEKAPLLIPRNDKAYFDNLCTLSMLDELLCGQQRWHPELKLFHNGAQVPSHMYVKEWSYGRDVFKNLIDSNKIMSYFDMGATINIIGLERMLEAVSSLNQELEMVTGFPVHTTGFLTPTNASNIPPHFDMVDFFVVQISGTKRWRVWDNKRGFPLVAKTRDIKRTFEIGEPEISKSKVLIDAVLQPGDTLFCPRGFIHEAITKDDHSFHITIGANPYRIYDLTQIILDNAFNELLKNDEVRAFVSSSDDGLSKLKLKEQMDRIINLMKKIIPTMYDEGMKALDFQLVDTRHAVRPGQIASIINAENAGENSSWIPRKNIVYTAEHGAARTKIRYQGKAISFPRTFDEQFIKIMDNVYNNTQGEKMNTDSTDIKFKRELATEGLIRLNDDNV